MDSFPHFKKVAASWKGSEKEQAFVEAAHREKTQEVEANSDRELVEEEKISGLPPTEHDTEEAAEQGSSLSPEIEDILTEDPEEVEVDILEVFPNLPVSPIQKMEAASPHPDAVPPVDLTPQIPIPEQPSPPPLGVDVTPFQLSWKEVRKQRQMETVQKYKEKLKNEASFFSNQMCAPLLLN